MWSERWKTQELPEALALQTLDRHLLGHGLQIPGGGNSDGGNRSRLEKLPRPSISAGCNQQDFQFFREQWTRYKRASGESDEAKLLDQLMYCPDEASVSSHAFLLVFPLEFITLSRK